MTLRSLEVYNNYVRNLLGTDLHLFEFSVWVQTFAQSLISVFVPIILLGLSFSLKEVVIFYLIFHGLDVPLNLLAKRAIQKRGARFTVMFSIFAELFYLVLLYNMNHSWFELVLLAVFLAAFDAFYWVGHLYIFVQAAHNKNSKLRGDVSVLNIIRVVGGFFAPAIGAFILIKTNPHTLIFFSTLLMFASLLPLFQMRHLKFKPEVSSSSFAEFFRHPIDKINFFLDALSVFRVEVENIIWPLFIFVTFKSLKAVSLVPILISIGTLLVTYFAAKMSVRSNLYRLVALGSVGTAAVWLLRLVYIRSEFILIGSVLLISLLAIFIDVPLEVAIFDRGKRTDVLNSVTYLNLFRMLAGGLLFLCIFFAQNIFITSFYLVAGVMILFAIMNFAVSKYHSRLMQVLPEAVEIDIEKDPIS